MSSPDIAFTNIDRLVAILQDIIGTAGGVRMIGGGFGGAVVALLPHARVEVARAAVFEQYTALDGSAPLIMIETTSQSTNLLV